MQDLFLAGTDTTSITMEWTMAELVKNQRKWIQAELRQIVGEHGRVTEELLSTMTRPQAAIKKLYDCMHQCQCLSPARRSRTPSCMATISQPRPGSSSTRGRLAETKSHGRMQMHLGQRGLCIQTLTKVVKTSDSYRSVLGGEDALALALGRASRSLH